MLKTLKRALASGKTSKTQRVLELLETGKSVSWKTLRTKFEINLFSIWTLCSAVQLLLPTSLIKKQAHVNISSGYAMEPTANWSGQCCSRIARDMLFKCFALENPDLKVIFL